MNEQKRYDHYRDLHRQAWQWQVENPEQRSKDNNPFLQAGLGGTDKCFACVYVTPSWATMRTSDNCVACPCYWDEDGEYCISSNLLPHCIRASTVFSRTASPYYLWLQAIDPINSKECAERVRDSWPIWEERLRK